MGSVYQGYADLELGDCLSHKSIGVSWGFVIVGSSVHAHQADHAQRSAIRVANTRTDRRYPPDRSIATSPSGVG